MAEEKATFCNSERDEKSESRKKRIRNVVCSSGVSDETSGGGATWPMRIQKRLSKRCQRDHSGFGAVDSCGEEAFAFDGDTMLEVVASPVLERDCDDRGSRT